VTGVELVLLDAYNTLIDLDRAHETTIEKILRKENAGVSLPVFHAYWDERERQNLMEAVLRPQGRFVSQTGLNVKSLRETFSHFGIDGNAESGVELWVELSRRCRPFDDARPALEDLRERFSVGVVSNADNYPLLEIFRREGLDFEQVITSETARAYKPGARIFRYALKAFGRKAEAAAYVGDSPATDVAGAAGAGLFTVWLNRSGRALRPGEPAARRTVASLLDVQRALEQSG
jgi:2-haloalkanoic acid dehalogenase type II